MPQAGIVVDNWKLPIFERHLTGSGYSFKGAGDLTKDVTVLTVVTDNLEALAGVVKAANTEAAQTGRPTT